MSPDVKKEQDLAKVEKDPSDFKTGIVFPGLENANEDFVKIIF